MWLCLLSRCWKASWPTSRPHSLRHAFSGEKLLGEQCLLEPFSTSVHSLSPKIYRTDLDRRRVKSTWPRLTFRSKFDQNFASFDRKIAQFSRKNSAISWQFQKFVFWSFYGPVSRQKLTATDWLQPTPNTIFYLL